MYHGVVRDLQLRNLDEELLGDRYEPDSVVIDPDTRHFDLRQPERIERHIDALLAALR